MNALCTSAVELTAEDMGPDRLSALWVTAGLAQRRPI